MLGPDAAYMTPEQLAGMTGEQMEGLAPLCLGFVIELLPAEDWRAKIESKMGHLIANGAQLAWLIDQYRKQAIVFEAGVEPYGSAGPLLEDIGPVGGFRLDLAEVWACYNL